MMYKRFGKNILHLRVLSLTFAQKYMFYLFVLFPKTFLQNKILYIGIYVNY